MLDIEAVTDVDVTGADAFRNLRDWLDTRTVELGPTRLRPGRRERWNTSG